MTSVALSIEAISGSWLARCLGEASAAPLAADDVQALVEVMTVRHVAAGTVLFNRNDPAGEVFVIEKGRVVLSRPGADRTSFLQIMGPGEVIGDVGLLLGRSAPVDAVVLDDAEILCIPGADLVNLLTSRPRIAMRWMVSIAGRLASAQDRLEELLAGPLDYQLASLLLHAADDNGRVAASQQTIAQLLGARRPSVARSLGNLEKQGLIEKHYGQIHVIDQARLEALTS